MSDQPLDPALLREHARTRSGRAARLTLPDSTLAAGVRAAAAMGFEVLAGYNSKSKEWGVSLVEGWEDFGGGPIIGASGYGPSPEVALMRALEAAMEVQG